MTATSLTNYAAIDLRLRALLKTINLRLAFSECSLARCPQPFWMEIEVLKAFGNRWTAIQGEKGDIFRVGPVVVVKRSGFVSVSAEICFGFGILKHYFRPKLPIPAENPCFSQNFVQWLVQKFSRNKVFRPKQSFSAKRGSFIWKKVFQLKFWLFERALFRFRCFDKKTVSFDHQGSPPKTINNCSWPEAKARIPSKGRKRKKSEHILTSPFIAK